APPAGAPLGGPPPPAIFSSIVISLSVCVMTQETLSAFWTRWERPWLLLLSSVQVPAKFGAAACAARANTSALVRPKAKSNFLIQDLLQIFVISYKGGLSLPPHLTQNCKGMQRIVKR